MSNTTVSPDKQGLKITIDWRVCAFASMFLPILIGLGFWQLQRAEEKRTIQHFAEAQQALPPESIANIFGTTDGQNPVPYRRVRGRGQFDQEHYWLLDNQTHRGRNGFHVIVPFTLDSGEILLVDRGWAPGSGFRDETPKVKSPVGELDIMGQLVKPSKNNLLAAENRELGAWPRTILQIDFNFMANELNRPILPWLLQIDSESPLALQVMWQVVNVPVSKHLGYAYQWFAMALALLILTVFANTNLGAILKKK